MEKKLQVVIGGTSGMGLSTAFAVSKFGPVLICGRSEKKLDAAIEQLKAAGVDAYGKSCDISSRTSLDELVAYAQSLGEIGNVINAAGVDAGGADLIININYVGTINVVEAFYPVLKDACLVNYSSITGYFHRPDANEIAVWNEPTDTEFAHKVKEVMANKDVDPRMAHLGVDYLYYAASKAFVIYYTKANTLRFGQKNCRIFSVAPGAFDTPMLREQSDDAVAVVAKGTALQRLGKPEEMAAFITRLLEPGLEYLTGCDLILDGGKSAMVLAKQL